MSSDVFVIVLGREGYKDEIMMRCPFEKESMVRKPCEIGEADKGPSLDRSRLTTASDEHAIGVSHPLLRHMDHCKQELKTDDVQIRTQCTSDFRAIARLFYFLPMFTLNLFPSKQVQNQGAGVCGQNGIS
jgi:hypothetical protein